MLDRQSGFAAISVIEQGDCSIHLVRELLALLATNGTILATELFGRDGRAVECAGLEIRIRDFGLNWTVLDSSVLLY